MPVLLAVEIKEDLKEFIIHNFEENIKNNEFDVVFVNNEFEAIEFIREEDDIDIVILNIETNYLNLLSEIKLIKPSTKVILISSCFDLTQNIEKKNSGIFELLSNPLDSNQFKKVLNDAYKISSEEKLISEKKSNAGRIMQEAREKLDYLSNLSHEIRTPLNGIYGFINLLNSTQMTEEQNYYVNNAKIAIDHLMNVVNDVLDYSKIESGKISIEKTYFCIKDLLSEIAVILGPKISEKNLDFAIKISPDVPICLKGDPLRTKQVILNLLNNAVKFTEKGKVIVDVNYEKNIDGTNKISFNIIDTGIGISIENQNKLFSPFTQADSSVSRKFGGTGLGLVISKKLAELMNGDITFESSHGEGSIFTFCLNVIDDDLSNVESCQKTKSSYDKIYNFNYSLNILVAEDNKINQELIKNILKQANLSCDVADNGLIAYNLFKKNKYDLILLDIQMPELDGIQTIKRIRRYEDDTRIPVIALTADLSEHNREVYINSGFDDIILKPFDFNLLFEKITVLTQFNPDISILKNEKTVAINASLRDEVINYVMANLTFNEELAVKVVNDFVKEAGNETINIKSFIKDRNYDNIRKSIHKLKGTVGLLNIEDIMKPLNKLSDATTSNDYDKCIEFLENIEEKILMLR